MSSTPEGEDVFRCEEDRYDRTIFGSFDGFTSWEVNLFVHESTLRQEVVSRHEERHLRLQKGTTWGVAAICAGLGAGEGSAADRAWKLLIDASRRSHEAYATYFSLRNVDPGLETLRGNLAYLSHLRDARMMREALDVDDANADVVLEFLFHLLMSPTRTADANLSQLRDPVFIRDVLLEHSPDNRMRSLLRHLADDESFSIRLVEAIINGRPDTAQRQDAAAEVLTMAGLPTLGIKEQESTGLMIADELNASSENFRVTLTARSRATSLEDQLDYQSFERAAIHSQRLPLIVSPDTARWRHPLQPFVRGDADIGAHVWLTWLPTTMLAAQFKVAEDALKDEDVLGLIAADRTQGPSVAYLMPISGQPSTTTEKFQDAGIDVLAMTTVRTLARTHTYVRFSPSAPLFVLVDQPILPTLQGLGDPAHNVLWSPIEIDGDRNLHVIVLKFDDANPVHFVHLTTVHGYRSVAEWLSHAEGFTRIGEKHFDTLAHLTALIRHLVDTFAYLATR